MVNFLDTLGYPNSDPDNNMIAGEVIAELVKINF